MLGFLPATMANGGSDDSVEDSSHKLKSLTDDFVLSQYGHENGMPEVAVNSIAMTADGFLWCLTPNYLLRFDGISFEPREGLDQGAIRDPYPMIYKGWTTDAAGTLWIYGRRGVASLTPSGWQRVTASESYHNILCMASDQANNLWAAADDGIWQISGKHMISVTNLLNRSALRLNCAIIDSDGSFLLGGASGLLRFRSGQFECLPFGSEFPPAEVFCLHRSHSGALWICSEKGLLHDNGDQKFKQIAMPFMPSEVTTLLEDATGRLWVGTKQGLYQFNNGTWSILNSLAAASPVNVLSLMEDKQHSIWAGTRDGLFCLHSKSLRSLHLNPRQNRQTVTSLAIHNTNILAGTLREGILRVQGDHLAKTSESILPKDVPVTALCADNKHGLWVGTLGKGLLYWVGGGLIRSSNSASTSLNTRDVSFISQDMAGSIWMGSWRGLFSVRINSNAVSKQIILDPVPLKISVDIKPYLNPNRVTAISPGNDGGLWVAYDTLPVIRRDPDPDRMVLGYSWGLPSPDVQTIYRDSKNVLWAGTGRGLARRSPGAAQWLSISAANGLTDEDIRQIIEDGKGRIWLGTRHGIQVFDRLELERVFNGSKAHADSQVLSRDDGMDSEECTLYSSPGVISDSLGFLYFATTDGLIQLDSDAINIYSNPPPVYLLSVTDGKKCLFDAHRMSPFSRMQEGTLLINAGAIARNTNGASVEALFDSEAPYILNARTRSVTFNFKAPVFIAQQRERFRWRLDGVDSDWSKWTTDRSVSYSRLVPGNYRFHIMVEWQGIQREANTLFYFRVNPYFYETILAKSLFVVFILSCGIIAMWFITRRRYRRKLRLLSQKHALEAERARIARDLHDELGVGLTEIGLLGDLAGGGSTISEDGRGLCSEISSRARELAGALDEIVWAVNPINDNSRALGNYFSRFAQNLLQRADLQCHLNVALYPDLKVSADQRHQLFLAFKEALNNIICHAHATEVNIDILTENGALIIRIKDNGQGFHKADTSISPDGIVGMGERLRQIGGKCEVGSQMGQGTTVLFKINHSDNK